MTTTPRHPLNKRIPDRRRPTEQQLQLTAEHVQRIASAAPTVAAALERFAKQVGLALTEWQQRVLRQLYPEPPLTRDDLTLTR